MKAQSSSNTARARLNPIYPNSKRPSASYTGQHRVVAVSPTSLQSSTVSKRRSVAASPRTSYRPVSYGASAISRGSPPPQQQRYPLLAQQHHQRALHAQRVASRNAQLSSLDRGIRLLLEEEYREDVKAYMLEKEKTTMSVASAMDQQPELQWHMRSHLLDFLIEIHFHFRLRPETLYLTLSILDRYVSRRVVYKKHYQLVGCVALWLASKFEDAKERVPSVKDLKDLCGGAFEEGAFVQMEGHVLGTVEWDLGHPTAESWLRILVTETYSDGMYGLLDAESPFEETRVQHVARFLMELTLYGRDYVQFAPSIIALGSLALARYVCGKGRRPADESPEILSLIALLDHTLAQNIDSVSQTLIKKYSFGYYLKASSVVVSFYLRGNRFPAANSPSVPKPEVLKPVVVPVESMRPLVPQTPVRQTIISSWGSVSSDASTPGLVRSGSSSSMDLDSEIDQARSRRYRISTDDSEEEVDLYGLRTERASDMDSEDGSEYEFDMQTTAYGHHHHHSTSSSSSGSMLMVPSSDDMYDNGDGRQSMPLTPTTPLYNLDPFGTAQSNAMAPLHTAAHGHASKDSKDLTHYGRDKENMVPHGHSHSHQSAFVPCHPANVNNVAVGFVDSVIGMEDMMVGGEYRPALLAIVP